MKRKIMGIAIGLARLCHADVSMTDVVAGQRYLFGMSLVRTVSCVLLCCELAVPSAFGKVFQSYKTDDGWWWRYTTTDPADTGIFREDYVDGVYYYGGSAEIVDYTGSGGDVAIPSVVTYKGNGYDCIAVVRSVYGPDRTQEHGLRPHFDEYQKYVTKLTIPDTVKSIGQTAFMYGSLLETVEFSDALEKLSAYAFLGCPKLKSVNLTGGKLKSLGREAFSGCTNLQEVAIDGDGTLIIPTWCFYDCAALKSVSFGAGVRKVGKDWLDGAFDGCVRLEEIDFGGVVDIYNFGYGVGSASVKTLDLDFTKTSVTNVNGLSGSSVGSVRLPAGMIVGDRAFQGCGRLREITFSDGVVVGEYAFTGCTQLCEVVNSPAGAGLYWGCTALTNAVLRSDVTEIPSRLFYHCSALNGISFAGAETITSSAVYDGHRGAGVALFSPGITSYCADALGGCAKIGQIVFMGNEPAVVNDYNSPYGYDPPKCTVYVSAAKSGWTVSPAGNLPELWPATATYEYWRVPIKYLPVEIALSTQDGSPDSTIIREIGEEYGELPTPMRDGFMFRGWFSAPSGGRYIQQGTRVKAEDALYAHWLEGTSFTHPITVTYDLQDGESVSVQMIYEAGGLVDWIPETERCNYTCTGWFAQPAGGEPVLVTVGAPTEDVTLYAQWTAGEWQYAVTDGKASISSASGYPNDVTTPRHLGGYPVVEIGDQAFWGCTNLCSLVVSPGVTNIGELAFVPTFFITNAVLPSSLRRIGDRAFVYAPLLETLTFDYRIGEIGAYAFCESPMITNVLVSTNTVIGTDAFHANCVVHRAEQESEILCDVLTDGKELFVPREWIEAERLKSLYGPDDTAATVLKKTTGKHDGGGNALCVWHDYVAGTDPTNMTSQFTAAVVIQDGVPIVTWKPDLKTERNYKVWGSTNLVNGGDWEWPTNALHRFFKVTVEMP